MKISVDAAALCDKTQEYGNFTVTKNILEGIRKIDKKNDYSLYSFCKRPPELVLGQNMRYKRILPKKLWLSTRVSLEEFLKTKDIFLALNQAIPLFTNARIFAFSHGLSYYFFKDLYQDSYDVLKDQLFTMMDKSEQVFVSSKKVQKEISSVFLKSEKVKVLPYGIPFDMITNTIEYEEISHKVHEVGKKFFLYVGMDHPIKNIKFLVDAFTIFSQQHAYKNYSLLLVGAEFEGLEIKSSNIKRISSVRRNELKYLYQKAEGYLSASLYESFNLPVLEALSQNCPVIARSSAVIPELDEYVYTADHVEDFIESMKIAASGKTRVIPVKKIRDKFSWTSYIERLMSFYTPS